MFFFLSQVKSVDFDKYLYQTDQGPAKKIRRESSSLVDEFFKEDDCKDNPNLQTAKQMVNHGLLGRKRFMDLNNLRTGLYNPPRSHGSEGFRREISPLVEEIREDGLQRLGLVSSPAKTTKIDLSETMMDPASMMSSGFVDLREQSKQVDDSIWEDVKDSIDMVNSKDNSNSDDPIVIKQEESDISFKPACQFQNSRIPSFENISVKIEPSTSSCLLAGSNSAESLSSRPKSLSVSQQQMMFSQSSPVAQYMAQLNSIALNKSSMTSPTFSMATPPHMVPVFLPPTPPSSEPNSPSQDVPMRRTPPPPYPGIHQDYSTLNIQPIPYTPSTPRSSNKIQKTHPGCSTIKYNRKNNPDLEKRRIHFCDFPGNYFFWSYPLFRFKQAPNKTSNLIKRMYRIDTN